MKAKTPKKHEVVSKKVIFVILLLFLGIFSCKNKFKNTKKIEEIGIFLLYVYASILTL